MRKRRVSAPTSPAAWIVPFESASREPAPRRATALLGSVVLHAAALAALLAGRPGEQVVSSFPAMDEIPIWFVPEASEARPAARRSSSADGDQVPVVPERAAPVAAPVAAPDEDLPGDWPLDPAASHPPRAGQGAPDSLPRAIGWELPVYPETMRRLSRETVVRATFLVHKDGSVDGVRVVGPPEFAQAVEQAILRTRFVPAMRDGRPVAHGLSVVFRFRLTGAGVAISPE